MPKDTEMILYIPSNHKITQSALAAFARAGYNGSSLQRQSHADEDTMAKVTVSSEWCKGCHICVEVCPRRVLEVDGDAFLRGFHPVRVVRSEDCTSCRQCELLCPDLAIMVEEGID